MTIRGPIREDDTQVLKVERPFYQQQQFNSELSYCKPDTTKSQSCSAWMNDIKPLKFISSIFPIFTWMSQYNIRSDLICDLISGCTVAVMHIPQGKLNDSFVQSDSGSVSQKLVVFYVHNRIQVRTNEKFDRFIWLSFGQEWDMQC